MRARKTGGEKSSGNCGKKWRESGEDEVGVAEARLTVMRNASKAAKDAGLARVAVFVQARPAAKSWSAVLFRSHMPGRRVH